MENAVKALMMAAGVLIGVMILSLGVALFSSMSGYIDTTQKAIDENAVQKFNEQFTRYINCNTSSSEPEFTLTIQDIVTAANTAYESNQKYGLTEHTESNYYVKISMPEEENLEKVINERAAEILNENIGKKYICTLDDVVTNQNTGRVWLVRFSEHTD